MESETRLPLFTSDRERRLWLWALVVLLAIYATIGPARILTEELRERNLLRISSTVVLAMVVMATAVLWLRRRPGWREIGVAFGVSIVYLMAIARVQSLEERTHLFEYGVMAVLIHQALKERVRNGATIRFPAVVAIAVGWCLGLVDELVQWVLPNRVYDIRDVGFNVLAVAMAIGASLALERARRRRRSAGG